MKSIYALIVLIVLSGASYGQGVEASKIRKTTFSNLGTPTDGQVRECTNCAITAVTGVCASGGSEPVMARANGTAWICANLKPVSGGSGGVGNVVGPASATDNHLAVFDGATGKLIKDGGAIPTATPAGSNGDYQYNNSGAFGGKSSATVKSDLSLNNVDNTSDANKPVSTAQQTALDLKANLASPTFTGTVGLPIINGSGQAAFGFGATTPPTGPMLTVASTINTSPRGILSAQFSTDTAGARVGFQKARGSVASPSTVVTGDTLGRMMFRGYDGTGYLEMGSIEVSSTGTIGTNRVPTQMIFSTATDAATSVLTTALTIGADQKVTHAAQTVLTGLTTQSVGQTTSATTDFLINPTTKSSGNLIDAQVNGTSQFSVNSAGGARVRGDLEAVSGIFDAVNTSFNSGAGFYSSSADKLTLSNWATTDAPLVQFGGATSSFPALKRNATALDVKLADDSALAPLNTGSQTINVGATTSAATDFLINPTTKASGNLIDAQVNGSSKFSVSASAVTATTSFQAASGGSVFWASSTTLQAPANGKLFATNSNGNGFQSLVLGATAPSTIGTAPSHGQTFTIQQAEELLTIAASPTSATTMQIPAGAIVLSVSTRVTTVIPTAATFTVTGTTSATTFNTAAVGTAATTTDQGTAAGAYYNGTAQTITITPNLTPADNTGRVRVTVSYILITPPTS